MNDGTTRTLNVLEKGKSRMGLDLEILIGLARRQPSPTSKNALQAEMYVIEIIMN